MRVTRIRRTKFLAVITPGDWRTGLSVRIAASLGDRTVRAENAVPVGDGLVRVTLTEMQVRRER